MTDYRKPLPLPDQDSKPFWDRVREHNFSMQRCKACGHFRFPPRIICPECSSFDYEWAPLSGRAKVFAHVTYHHIYGPMWASDVPYNVSIIELDEGPKLFSNVVGCKPEEVHVGMPLELVYDDVTEEFTLPKFRPALA